MGTDLKPSVAAAEMSTAASKLLDTWTPSQRAKATFPFGDGERIFWHHPPLNQIGVSLKEMNQEQRGLAYTLLASGLTNQAYKMARLIMDNELLLRETDRQSRDGPAKWPLPPGYMLERDPEYYFFTIFGEPGDEGPWSWRVQGHHISLNFSLFKGEVVGTTPFHFGSSPAEVGEGPKKGQRILSVSEDMALDLMGSLDKAQRAKAIVNEECPWELLTYNSSRAVFMPNEGLPAANMDATQKGMLTALITDYISRVRPDVSRRSLDKMKEQGLDSLYLTWAGPVDRSRCHYYRIAGGYFMIEFVNPDNQSNHIHSVWRDVEDDFGLYGPNNLSHLMMQHHFA